MSHTDTPGGCTPAHGGDGERGRGGASGQHSKFPAYRMRCSWVLSRKTRGRLCLASSPPPPFRPPLPAPPLCGPFLVPRLWHPFSCPVVSREASKRCARTALIFLFLEEGAWRAFPVRVLCAFLCRAICTEKHTDLAKMARGPAGPVGPGSREAGRPGVHGGPVSAGVQRGPVGLGSRVAGRPGVQGGR